MNAPRRPMHAALLAIALAALLSAPRAQGQTTLLVDFGGTPGGTSFGLAGWNSALLSANLSYSAEGPGGVVASTDLGDRTDFRGVRGTARAFARGERIAVTWYNTSDDPISFTARISFTDADVPDGGSSSGSWFTMRQVDDYRRTFCTVAPHASCRTAFNIENAGVHKSDGTYSLVNINLYIEWEVNEQKAALVCDRIELMRDADITPPTAPVNVSASAVSHAAVALRWDPASDNTGVAGYLVSMNGKEERYASSNVDTILLLDAGTSYSFTVRAMDRCGNLSASSAPVAVSTKSWSSARSDLLQPTAFSYLGAVRFPEAANWGGEGLAYNPGGDGGASGAGAADGFPGSVFTTNINTPENGFVAEFGIPAPKIRANPDDLDEAAPLQNFTDIRPANVSSWPFVDVWNTGLACLPGSGGMALYSTWGFYYQVTSEKTASLSVCRTAPLAGAPRHGAWFVNTSAAPLDAALNDYLFALPADWAAANTNGQRLVTGRNREGGLSGLGPTLYAVSAPELSSPPAAGAELPSTPLLQYGPVEASSEYQFPNAFAAYHHADWFKGAAWISAGQRSAAILIGQKALGEAWYGYTGENMRHDWVIADIPYPDYGVTDPDGKGWRGHSRIPMIVLYDPADLARVAHGTLQPHQPQPYGAVRLNPALFSRPAPMLRDASYDAARRILYAVEMNPDRDGVVLMHAWRVDPGPVAVEPLPIPDNGIRIYPQPAAGVFRIETATNMQIERVVLADALGRRVWSADGPVQSIDAAGFAPGLYFLSVGTSTGMLRERVLIAR